jgi:SgrR family transcriptional regulator
MHVFEVYEELRKHFTENEGETIPITLEEVSSLLICSKRNANFALKRLIEKNWIAWIPGRGRGNSSAIVFHLSIQEMYVEVAKEKFQKDDIRGSLQMIEDHVTDVSLKGNYFQWLYHSFGMNPANIHNGHLDTLKVPVLKQIGSLDPILTTCGIEAHLVKHLFDTLVDYNPISNQLEQGLAHHWEAKNNHKEWIFYLRKGVLFHDGNECTSKDVERTIHRVNGKESIYRWITRDILKMETPNKWTIRIFLSKPNPYFLHFIASHPLSIISENTIRQGFKSPIGTGPFKVISNDESSLILDSNRFYFCGRPFLDRVELWKTVVDSTALVGARPDSFQLKKLLVQKGKRNNGEWDTVAKLENGCKLITFNLNLEGPQQNKLFRKAIDTVINRSMLVQQFTLESYSPAYSLLPNQKDFQVETQEEYVSLARKYLKESGYSGETINLYCSVYHENDAMLLQTLCRNIGIQIEVKKILKELDSPYPHMENPHLVLYECLFDHDLTFSVLETYMTEDSYIRRHLSDKLLLAVEDKINRSIYEGIGELRDVLDSIEQELRDNYVYICLYRRNRTIQYSPELRGIQIDSLGWVNFKKIWYI